MVRLRRRREHAVELFTRPGCHLCEDARAVVQEVCARAEVPWTETSIDGDAELIAQYGELIPVVLVDDRRHAVFRVDPDRLRAALR